MRTLASLALSLIAMVLALAFGALIGMMLLFALGTAYAHDAPTGWRYDASCCSNIDCRAIKASDIDEVQSGYDIKLSELNEIIPYGDKRIKDSPDGLFHWCSYNGKNNGKTICLYVPPRGM